MRITSSQLRRIIMEEVAAAKRQKSIQETNARRRTRRVRNINESPYANAFLRPKETAAAAGFVLVGLIIAAGLSSIFVEDSRSSEVQDLAAQACVIAAEQGSGESCRPDQAIEQAKAHFANNESLGMSTELDQSYSTESGTLPESRRRRLRRSYKY